MKQLLGGLFILISASYFGQSFKGSIEFKYYTQRDTTANTYWVKEEKIKLDQYSKKTDAIEGSFIFDLTEKTIKFVNPKRKVWGDQKSEIPPVLRGKCEVSKGHKNKTVNGFKCTEYTVKNTEENTIIVYYIAADGYDFFGPMMELWNRKDKQSIYFAKIKGLSKGAMPMMSEERQIDGNKFMSKLEVVKINRGNIDDNKLTVPEEYKKFDQ